MSFCYDLRLFALHFYILTYSSAGLSVYVGAWNRAFWILDEH